MCHESSAEQIKIDYLDFRPSDDVPQHYRRDPADRFGEVEG
jgi:hypothetical protein